MDQLSALFKVCKLSILINAFERLANDGNEQVQHHNIGHYQTSNEEDPSCDGLSYLRIRISVVVCNTQSEAIEESCSNIRYEFSIAFTSIREPEKSFSKTDLHNEQNADENLHVKKHTHNNSDKITY